MDSIYGLIEASLEDPFQPVEEVDFQEKELSRVQCSTNVLHQADQILRKLVAQEMSRNKGMVNVCNVPQTRIMSYGFHLSYC